MRWTGDKLIVKRGEIEKLGHYMNTKEGRAGFVSATWPALAMYAYDAYMEMGRGALVVTNSETGPEPPHYLPQGTPDTPEGLETMIREYDPDREIVVLFAQNNPKLGQFCGCETFSANGPNQSPKALWEQKTAANLKAGG